MRSILALALSLGSAVCIAESIHAYKSVHADGTVSYSDTRPASAMSVQTIEILQTEGSVLDQGEQRQQQMQDVGKQLDEQRADESEAKRAYETRLAEARKELREAEHHLDTTLNSRKNATPERMASAEERLELARKKLREVERAGP